MGSNPTPSASILFSLVRTRSEFTAKPVSNVTSKHGTRWLGAESRCVVPFNSFSEFSKAEGGDIWFALEETRPLAYFATGRPSGRSRKARHQRRLRFPDDGPERRGRRHPHEGNAGDPDDAGRGGDLDDRASGQGPQAAAPLPDGSLRIVARGVKEDPAGTTT